MKPHSVLYLWGCKINLFLNVASSESQPDCDSADRMYKYAKVLTMKDQSTNSTNELIPGLYHPKGPTSIGVEIPQVYKQVKSVVPMFQLDQNKGALLPPSKFYAPLPFPFSCRTWIPYVYACVVHSWRLKTCPINF